ncbi:MAG: UDP-2,3-diacylglucosamine diphosphatase [Gammaproteobacteria bacterium]|nr:MAG: UDP-2,3-diacylglucosamine diphosphatase [Gammaproteobacteria bacterium]
MSQTLFVSDLHLDQKRPHIIAAFCRFLHECSSADALYILGDLFEYWIGDDDPAIGLEPAISAIRKLSNTGVPVYFIHGNRDFLIGKRFAKQTQCKILKEETVLDLYGTPTLIMHGDTLCTDDIAYQKYRAKARNPFIQKPLLMLSVKRRLIIAEGLRNKSKSATQDKPEDIMDVNQLTVEQVMQKHNVNHLIHGHTHRPAKHEFNLGGNLYKRIVLGDWYEHGSVLRCTPNLMKLETINT